jgi:hypothetical protein
MFLRTNASCEKDVLGDRNRRTHRGVDHARRTDIDRLKLLAFRKIEKCGARTPRVVMSAVGGGV